MPSAGPSRALFCSPVAESHTSARASQPAVASSAPSALKPTAVIESVWPPSSRTGAVPASGAHARPTSSPPPATIASALGWNATAYTESGTCAVHAASSRSGAAAAPDASPEPPAPAPPPSPFAPAPSSSSSSGGGAASASSTVSRSASPSSRKSASSSSSSSSSPSISGSSRGGGSEPIAASAPPSAAAAGRCGRPPRARACAGGGWPPQGALLGPPRKIRTPKSLRQFPDRAFSHHKRAKTRGKSVSRNGGRAARAILHLNPCHR